MWKTVKLGDICDLQNGFAFKSSDYVDNSNTLNIRMSNIRPNGEFDESHNIRFLPDNYATKYADYKLIEGDLIIAMTDMAGNPKILGMPTIVKNLDGRAFLLNQRVGKLHKFSDDIFVPYLCHFLSTLKNFYKNKGAGGLQINISKKDILSATIPLPPLAEQQRIVAKLDAAFAEIDGAIESAVRKETEVQKLKASLLSSSLSGDAVMWKTVKLGDVCDLSTGGTPSRTKPEYFDNGDVKWLVSGDVNQREIFDCDGRITQEGLKSSNAKYLPLNSVLIALNGQGKTRGTVALLRINATCNQSLVAISPKVGCDIDTKYIFYVLDGMYDKIRKLTGDSGNDRRGLNMPLIRNIPIPLPPLAEQQRIVAKLDAIFSELAVAKEAIKQSKTNYQAMKSAILAQELQSEAA